MDGKKERRDGVWVRVRVTDGFGRGPMLGVEGAEPTAAET